MLAAKVKCYELRKQSKSKADLSKQLEELRNELSSLRVTKVLPPPPCVIQVHLMRAGSRVSLPPPLQSMASRSITCSLSSQVQRGAGVQRAACACHSYARVGKRSIGEWHKRATKSLECWLATSLVPQ